MTLGLRFPSFASVIFLAAYLVPFAFADLRSRLKTAGVDALFPGDAGFPLAAAAFNERYEYIPAAIAFPSSAQQVSKTVLAGRAEHVSVNARGGGHSYVAYSLGGGNGHLIIDLRRFNNVTVDASTGHAKVGAGNRLGDIALGLNDHGRAMSHGTCAYVGIGGHALFGGYGFTSRQWGLALDNVLEHEVVLANGSIVTASASSNPDLYWALRGAGASFGIVTSYTFRTFPAPPSTTVFTYGWDLSSSAAAKSFEVWQSFAASGGIPTDFGAELTLGKGSVKGKVSVRLVGAYYASNSTFGKVIQPFLSQMPSKPTVSVDVGSYIASVQNLAGSQPLSTKGQNLSAEHDTFYVKSLSTPSSAPMTNKSLTAFANYLANEGFDSDTDWFVEIEQWGGKDSAVNAVAPDATSFSERNQLFTIQFYASSGQPPYPADGFSFLDNMVASITNNNPADWKFGAYPNYDDDRLSKQEWHTLYYRNHYTRLSQVKKTYDPTNVFNFQQAITPASSGRRALAPSRLWGSLAE